MQGFYIVLDTLSLVIILGILFSSRSKGGAGGGIGQMGMNKTKKF
jgi:hypothetical protein